MKRNKKPIKKINGQNHPRENKKGRPKKGQKMHNLKGPKKARKLISFMVGNYFTHNSSNVTNMQIMRSNSNGKSRINIACQSNFPFKSRSQSVLENNTNTLPEKLNAKKQK
jgi:hypothetical protein